MGDHSASQMTQVSEKQEVPKDFWTEAAGLLSQLSLTLSQMKNTESASPPSGPDEPKVVASEPEASESEALFESAPEQPCHSVNAGAALLLGPRLALQAQDEFCSTQAESIIEVETRPETDTFTAGETVVEPEAVSERDVEPECVTEAVSKALTPPMKEIKIEIQNFNKKSFDAFQRHFSALKRVVRLLRGSGNSARSYYVQDLTSPSLELLLVSLAYLNIVLQLIAACIPSEPVLASNRRHALLTTKLVHLFHSIHDLFEKKRTPALSEEEEKTLREKFYRSKTMFQMYRRGLDKGGKVPVSEKAYNATIWFWDDHRYFGHIVAATKFATNLTKICYVMMSRLILSDALDPESLRGTVTLSFKYFCIQSPDKDYWCAYVHRDQIDARLEAFRDLSYYIIQKGYIICSRALMKQHDAQAVVVYTVLWHVLTFMQTNQLVTPELAMKVNYKFGTLRDKQCEKRRKACQTTRSKIVDPLTRFWSDKAYMGTYTTYFQTPMSDVGVYEDFCLAMLRFALVNTPQRANRSNELAAWVELCSNVLSA